MSTGIVDLPARVQPCIDNQSDKGVFFFLGRFTGFLGYPCRGQETYTMPTPQGSLANLAGVVEWCK